MTASTTEKSIIEIKNLSKQYSIGVDKTYKTLCDSFMSAVKKPLNTLKDRRRSDDTFWALKGVSFNVEPGEVLGVIGRNGAGKSTLLKVLSRITYPTEGEIRMRGRVGSLLEVGTGFHPELTGRENIYFNGAILGMKKWEIDSKFDDIVKFSGVEKFLDTPVKRYSSGMNVRLAFSVAAHLEPEILVVDEVLAVGDMEFQKKCLKKMEDISKGEGRTVLFVSHNMAAIESLCSRAILLEKGKITFDGDTKEAISRYLEKSKCLAQLPIKERTDREGNGNLKIVDIVIGVEGNEGCGYWQTGKNCIIEFKYETDISKIESIDIGFGLYDLNERRVFSANNIVLKEIVKLTKNKGSIFCKIERLPIYPGEYHIKYNCYNNNILLDKLENSTVVNIDNGDFYGTGILWGGYSTTLTDYKWYF